MIITKEMAARQLGEAYTQHRLLLKKSYTDPQKAAAHKRRLTKARETLDMAYFQYLGKR